MRKMLWSCVVVGVVSILLSFIGVFLPLDGLRRWNLPFQVLIISLRCGSIPFPKPMATNFIDILSLPFFDYFFSTILITSGIGIIWSKSWGRFLGYIYAMSIIVISAIGFPIILRGYIREFTHIEKYGFLEGLIWGGIGLYSYASRRFVIPDNSINLLLPAQN
ncbi:MAG: hypothetical protein V1699_05895 [Candidatus Omnitrophota bacterium]